MFFEIENGRPFEPFSIGGRIKTIHAFYGSAYFKDVDPAALESFARLALVRDPVARVVSCYRNRIGAKDVLARKADADRIAEMGLSAQPSLSEFVAKLRRYQKASRAIRHHSHPLSQHLGMDPAYFTRIYPLRQIQDFVDEVARFTGSTPTLPHLQSEGSNVTVADLSPQEVARIREIYAEDYEIFGEWF
jgi:hypothetical protein